MKWDEKLVMGVNGYEKWKLTKTKDKQKKKM